MLLSYAVIRDGDSPRIYAATDIGVLHRVLALKVVAATPVPQVPPSRIDALRSALLEERWADALIEWIEITDIEVDVFENGLDVWSADRLADPELLGLELQLSALFREQ